MTLAVREEITAELLGDIGKALRAILVNDYGVRAGAVDVDVRPGRLTIRAHRAGAVPDLEAKVSEMLAATRATIEESLPSLAEGLAIRLYLWDPLEIVVEASAPAPIYPHIITASIPELRATPAGKLAIAKGDLKPWL